MSKVYVHIGLPKTATTTLQRDLFPYVDGEKYFYAGATQPRGGRQDGLFTAISAGIAGGGGELELNQKIREELQKAVSLIISEEMILVSSDSVSWREKLSNLASILNGVEYRILLSVRDPVPAMFSFYVERYYYYSKGKGVVSTLLNNDDFKVYNYDYLLEILSSLFDEDRLFVQSFEDLVLGDYAATMEFLESPKLDMGFRGLSRNNFKEKKEGVTRIPRGLPTERLRIIYKAMGGGGVPVLKSLSRLVLKLHKDFSWVKFGYSSVPDLDELEQKHLTEELKNTGIRLSKKFGIEY